MIPIILGDVSDNLTAGDTGVALLRFCERLFRPQRLGFELKLLRAGWPWVITHPGLPQIRTCPN